MHQVSDLYKQILRLPHRVENRLEIYGQVYTRAQIISLDTTRQIFKEEVPSVGNTPAGTIAVSMLTPPEEFPIQEKILLSSRIVSGDLKSEWVPKGTFYIDTRHPAQLSTGENVQIDLVGYDRMLMAERDYSPTGQWPRTDADVLAELCQLIGVECDEVLNKGYQISEPYEYTCRELLGFIGAMYGGNWVIDDFGKLRLLRLGSSGGASETVAQNLSVGTPLSPITRVVLHKMDGTCFTAGTAGRTLNVDCPWATQEMAEGILQQVQGYRYQPFSAEEAAIDPALELGDQAAQPGGAVIGTVYQLYTAHSDVLIADMAAPPEEEINHDFPARSTAGGTAGRAMGAARRLKKENQDSIRQASEKLVADIGDVRAGLHAVASADDIKELKEAKTTLFAQIQADKLALQAGIDARVKSEDFGKYREAVVRTYATIDSVNAGLKSKASVKYVDNTFFTKTASNELTAEVNGAKASLDTLAKTSLSKDEAGRIYYTQEAAAGLSARVDGAEASLSLKAEKNTVTALDGRISTVETASAKLSARVGDAEASLNLKVSQDSVNGLSQSVATLSADVINLKGRVDLTGILTVSETLNVDRGIFTNGNILCANVSLHDGGQVLCHHVTLQDGGYIRIGPKVFTPQEITSTTGVVTALGCA